MEVTVQNRQRGHRVDRREMVDFMRRLVDFLPAGADSVSVRLVSDRRMREANRTFRGKDATTDVLSFPTRNGPDPAGERHLGDILISVTRAASQAREADHALEQELKLLALHGYLHLLGYDHETDDGEMMRLQRKTARLLLNDRARGGSGT